MAIVRMTRAQYLQHNPGIKADDADAWEQAADEILVSPEDVEEMARDLGLPLPSWFKDWQQGPWIETQSDGVIIDDNPKKHSFGARPAARRLTRAR